MFADINTILILLVAVIILLSLLSLYQKRKREKMTPYPALVGKSFGNYYSPQKCNPVNNCFKGSYMRSQVYQNMCEPTDSRITREPVQVKDNCLRTLEDKSCVINKRNQRRCQL